MSISVPQRGGLLDASEGPDRELAPSELVPGHPEVRNGSTEIERGGLEGEYSFVYCCLGHLNPKSFFFLHRGCGGVVLFLMKSCFPVLAWLQDLFVLKLNVFCAFVNPAAERQN